MVRFLLLSLVVPALLDAPAAAQQLGPREVQRRFDLFDSDRDGRISQSEFELNKVIALFRPLERASGSGAPPGPINRQIAITRDTSRLTADAFDTLDTNSDGVLTGAEIIASDQMRFENIDRNNDDHIDRAEFQALVDSLFK